jgi:hypothetical protein
MASQVVIQVVPVVNRLFGETVTVSGLLSGGDVIEALEGLDLGEIVFLPQAMFADDRSEKALLPRTLDGLTALDIAERLDCRVVVAEWMSQVWNEMMGRRNA